MNMQEKHRMATKRKGTVDWSLDEINCLLDSVFANKYYLRVGTSAEVECNPPETVKHQKGVAWERIALDVEKVKGITRSAKACRSKWKQMLEQFKSEAINMAETNMHTEWRHYKSMLRIFPGVVISSKRVVELDPTHGKYMEDDQIPMNSDINSAFMDTTSSASGMRISSRPRPRDQVNQSLNTSLSLSQPHSVLEGVEVRQLHSSLNNSLNLPVSISNQRRTLPNIYPIDETSGNRDHDHDHSLDEDDSDTNSMTDDEGTGAGVKRSQSVMYSTQSIGVTGSEKSLSNDSESRIKRRAHKKDYFNVLNNSVGETNSVSMFDKENSNMEQALNDIAILNMRHHERMDVITHKVDSLTDTVKTLVDQFSTLTNVMSRFLNDDSSIHLPGDAKK